MADCCKHGYPSQTEARVALGAILEKRRDVNGKKPCRVYPCGTCDRWHLTSKPQSGRTPSWDLDPEWVRPSR